MPARYVQIAFLVTCYGNKTDPKRHRLSQKIIADCNHFVSSYSSSRSCCLPKKRNPDSQSQNNAFKASNPVPAAEQKLHIGLLADHTPDTVPLADYNSVCQEAPDLGFLGNLVLVPVPVPNIPHQAAEVDTVLASNFAD